MRSSARLAALALLVAAGAGQAAGTPADARYGSYQDAGLSSWYGEELLGNRTASGERFDPNGLTAAHRTLPLGSFVEVTCVETGRSVVVRINDRGPGRRDRIIDLSRGAARVLGTDRHAIATVRIRAISPAARSPDFIRAASIDSLPERAPLPKLEPGRAYSLQIATFSNEDRARALAERFDARAVPGGGFWRVRLGPFKTVNDVQRARDAVAARGYGDVRILPED